MLRVGTTLYTGFKGFSYFDIVSFLTGLQQVDAALISM